MPGYAFALYVVAEDSANAQERAEEGGRWSHKAGGRYMQGKLHYERSVPKKVVIVDMWSLYTSGR